MTAVVNFDTILVKLLPKIPGAYLHLYRWLARTIRLLMPKTLSTPFRVFSFSRSAPAKGSGPGVRPLLSRGVGPTLARSRGNVRFQGTRACRACFLAFAEASGMCSPRYPVCCRCENSSMPRSDSNVFSYLLLFRPLSLSLALLFRPLWTDKVQAHHHRD
jgi:hypothetical protein